MYNVAFVYTKEAKGYAGIITWTSFESKEEFDKFYTDDIKAHESVVEEGISEERCIELTKRTPASARIAAAKQEAGGCQDRLVFQLAMAAFAIREDAGCHQLQCPGDCDQKDECLCSEPGVLAYAQQTTTP